MARIVVTVTASSSVGVGALPPRYTRGLHQFFRRTGSRSVGSPQLLAKLMSADANARDAALALWRAEPLQSRDEAIAQLIASIRADREALWKLETEEYQEARFDPGFDNSAAQRETRARAEANDRLL